MQTEVHVYAFSVSAGMLLSFFPFLIVMLSLCQHVLHWKAAVNAIYFTLDDYFPDAFGHFLRRNFEVTVASRGPVQIISIVLLFFTASGIFESMEVALNRIWRCPTNRSYFKNQLIGLGLILPTPAVAVEEAGGPGDAPGVDGGERQDPPPGAQRSGELCLHAFR